MCRPSRAPPWKIWREANTRTLCRRRPRTPWCCRRVNAPAAPGACPRATRVSEATDSPGRGAPRAVAGQAWARSSDASDTVVFKGRAVSGRASGDSGLLQRCPKIGVLARVTGSRASPAARGPTLTRSARRQTPGRQTHKELLALGLDERPDLVAHMLRQKLPVLPHDAAVPQDRLQVGEPPPPHVRPGFAGKSDF